MSLMGDYKKMKRSVECVFRAATIGQGCESGSIIEEMVGYAMNQR
jgi:hypothetical protein